MGKKRERKRELNRKLESRRLIPISQKPKMSIAMAMPIHHYAENYTMMCADATINRLAEKNIFCNRVSIIGMPDIAKARNETVEIFLAEKNYTHLLWIDADMAWDPSAVEALIDLDVPVASCLVTKKGPPFDITMFQLMKPTENSTHMDTFMVPFGQYPLDKPFTFPHSGIGTAFMLVAREVIEKMESPYFATFMNPADRSLKGTDYYFCVNMIRHGYEIVYDPRPSVYHIGLGLYGVEDHIAYIDQQQEGGTKSCPFMNSGASVVEYKKSFAGPQTSLRQKVVNAGKGRPECFRSEGLESKWGSSSGQSLTSSDQTKAPMRIGTDVPKSPPLTEVINLRKPPKNEPTKIMSNVEH